MQNLIYGLPITKKQIATILAFEQMTVKIILSMFGKGIHLRLMQDNMGTHIEKDDVVVISNSNVSVL